MTIGAWQTGVRALGALGALGAPGQPDQPSALPDRQPPTASTPQLVVKGEPITATVSFPFSASGHDHD